MMAPEMCDSLLLIQAEFDGELDAADAARALQHRENCDACRAAYAEMDTARVKLHAAVPYYRVPENLRRAISAGIGAQAPGRPRRPTRQRAAWWRRGLSFAMGAGVAAALAFFWLAPAQQNLLDQVVAGHVRALQPGHLEDVASTDQHTVKPWFDGKLDFAPPVKDLAADNFPLLGGRLDYLDGRDVAALVYRHDKHLIDVFIWPDRGASAPLDAARDGYNAVHWSARGMSFWAVSDLEAGELQDFARRWRATP